MVNLSSNTQTATLNTDHTLYTSSGSTRLNQVVVVFVDVSNLANGETLILTIRAAPLTGGTVRDVERAVLKDAQGHPGSQSIPVPCPFGCDVILRQEGGTGRAFPWSVDNLAA